MCLQFILSMVALDSNNLIPMVLCTIEVFYRFLLSVHCSVQSTAPVPWVRHAITIENSSDVEIPQILTIRESPRTIFLALVKSDSVEFSGVKSFSDGEKFCIISAFASWKRLIFQPCFITFSYLYHLWFSFYLCYYICVVLRMMQRIFLSLKLQLANKPDNLISVTIKCIKNAEWPQYTIKN